MSSDRQRQTGIDRLTVDQHRAGAALAMVAALLCSGELQPIAQGIEEHNIGWHIQLPTSLFTRRENTDFHWYVL